MVKKAFAASLLALALVFAAAAQGQAPQAESGAMDVVVLLDSSQSVLPYFQDVTDYLLSSVVRDFLRFGDTFHLLSFGDSAQTEIAQKMVDERDVKSVLGRLYLLYPLARRSDFLGALGYLRQYLSDLPESRKKVVVIVTDGVHNPPASSPSAAYPPERVASEIEAACAAIRAKGWDLRLVRLPFAPATAPAGGTAAAPQGAGKTGAGQTASSNAPGAAVAASGAPATPAENGGQSYFDLAAKALGAPVAEYSADGKEGLAKQSLALPSVQYPGPLGKRGYSFQFPLAVRNGSDNPVGLELEGLYLEGSDILAKKSFLTLQPGKSGTLDVKVALPNNMEPGDKKLEVEPRFSGGVRVDPARGTLELTLRRIPFGAFFRSGARVLVFGIFVVVGLGIALALFLLARRVPRRAEAPVVAAVLDGGSAPGNAAAPGRTGRSAAGKPAAASPAAALPASKAGQAGAYAAGAAKPATVAGAGATVAPATPAGAAKIGPTAAPLSDTATRDAPPAAIPAAVYRGSEIRLERREDEHEKAIAREAEELAKAAKADAGRSADLLSEAAASRGSAASLERIAAFKARRPEAQASRAKAGFPSPSPRVVKPGTMRVEMRVEDQTANIGMRNVHTLHAGGSKSVGGGRSDFLVFLVPAANRAAELHFDGEKLAFLPRRPELFPGTEGPIEDCLDQDILMLGKGGYPLVLRFQRYEPPADRINRLLHCIETPGLFAGLDRED